MYNTTNPAGQSLAPNTVTTIPVGGGRFVTWTLGPHRHHQLPRQLGRSFCLVDVHRATTPPSQPDFRAPHLPAHKPVPSSFHLPPSRRTTGKALHRFFAFAHRRPRHRRSGGRLPAPLRPRLPPRAGRRPLQPSLPLRQPVGRAVQGGSPRGRDVTVTVPLERHTGHEAPPVAGAGARSLGRRRPAPGYVPAR